MGECRDRLPGLQSGEGQPPAEREWHDPAEAGGGAIDLSAAGEWSLLPAKLPPRKLAGFSLLGQRTGVLRTRGRPRLDPFRQPDGEARAGLHGAAQQLVARRLLRSEEHTSELQSLMRSSYAVFCLQKKKHIT